MRKRRAARAKAKAKQAQDMKQKLKGSKTKKQKKNQKKEQKRKLLKKQKAQKIVEESAKNYRRQGVGVLLVQQQMDRARRLDNAKFPGNLIFSNDNDLCRLKIENCKEVPWSKVREAAHPYLKVVFSRLLFLIIFECLPRVFKCFGEQWDIGEILNLFTQLSRGTYLWALRSGLRQFQVGFLPFFLHWKARHRTGNGGCSWCGKFVTS